MFNQADLLADKINTDLTTFTARYEPKGSNAYFKGAHWGQSLELLQHLCQYSDNMIVIIGAAGLGKTTLQQAFLAITQDNFHCCALTAESITNLNSCMQNIAHGFGLPYNHQTALADRITAALAHTDKLWVLLIDNAHLLAAEVLQALLQLSNAINNTALQGNCQFRLILLGELSLETQVIANRLSTSQEQHMHVLELEPLALTEVEPYLRFKWNLTNDQDTFPFNSVMIKKIYQLSAGNPQIVERLAQAQLAGGDLLNNIAQHRDNKIRFFVNLQFASILKVSSIIVGVSLLAIALLKPLLIEPTATSSSVVTIAMPIAKIPAVPALATIADNTSQKVVTESKVVEPAVMTKDSTVVVNLPITAPTAATTTDSKEDPKVIMVGDEAVLPKVLELERMVAEKTKANSQVVAKSQAEQPSPATVALPITTHDAKSAEQSAAAILAKTGIVGTEIDAAVPPAPVLTTKASKLLKTKPRINVATNSHNYKTVVSKQYTPEERQILQISGQRYTLQLLGSAKLASIKQFIAINGLAKHSYYYRTTRNNAAWYILIYGNYSSRAQAKVAIAQLPSSVRSLQPWVREFTAVKSTLQARN